MRGKDYRREPCQARLPLGPLFGVVGAQAVHTLAPLDPRDFDPLACQRQQTWRGTARLPHRHRHTVRDPRGREVATITWPDQPDQPGASR